MLSQTHILIIITCAISIPAFSNQKMLNDLIMYPPAIKRGQFYRLLTSGFIHADFTHLIFNMLTLYFFGRAMESFFTLYVGKWSFILFYISAIIFSDIPSYIKNINNTSYASLGASGGVSAVVFSYILFAPWTWFQFPPVPAIVYGIGYLVYSMYMSKKGGSHINHDAHFWGALFGVIFILIVKPIAGQIFIEQLMHPHGP